MNHLDGTKLCTDKNARPFGIFHRLKEISGTIYVIFLNFFSQALGNKILKDRILKRTQKFIYFLSTKIKTASFETRSNKGNGYQKQRCGPGI